MTVAVVNPDALKHLAGVVHHLRPDWDKPGIRSALEATLATHDYAHAAEIAVATARDPSVRTPGLIKTRCDRNWKYEPEPAPPEAKSAVPRYRDQICRDCGRLTHNDPDNPHRCEPVADPEHVRAIRAEISGTIQGTNEPEEVTP